MPATNAALVARVAELAALAGRPLATVAQTRATLGLPAAEPSALTQDVAWGPQTGGSRSFGV
ncbi:MAG TPA: 3-keto-5-aminohexanoate cleavage protein [Baekduia sp.]|nr:3-keto-5-aminohexanoate cleavage protein [Baekduia sp.]